MNPTIIKPRDTKHILITFSNLKKGKPDTYMTVADVYSVDSTYMFVLHETKRYLGIHKHFIDLAVSVEDETGIYKCVSVFLVEGQSKHPVLITKASA